jgi:hypothetical protein
MKRALQLFAITGIFAVSNECAADETPFQVSLQIVRDVPIIQLEAVANKVVLTGFNVNRGNCKSAKLGRSYHCRSPSSLVTASNFLPIRAKSKRLS